MHGPVLIMSTAIETSPGFPRSHSTSNLPALPILTPLDLSSPGTSEVEQVPRSASFSYLPSLDTSFLDEEKPDQLASSTPAEDKHPIVRTITEESNSDGKSKAAEEKQERLGRRKSLVTRSKSWIQKARISPERQRIREPVMTTAPDAPPVPAITKAGREKNKIVSGTLASLARKSWISTSRSPSPSATRIKLNGTNTSQDELSKMASSKSALELKSRASLGPVPQLEPAVPPSETPRHEASPAAGAVPQAKTMPHNVVANVVAKSQHSSTSSLPLMDSRRSSPRSSSSERTGPLRKMEKLQQLTHTLPSRRDELYSAFRSIESDFVKFQNKSWSLKANIVRSSLIPFLRNYESHPSNLNLRPEDVERRIEILNKWWNGLLELLGGRQTQNLSGVDRPVILDAITGIMTRPEWRLTPALISPSSEGSPSRSPERKELKKRKSTTSLASSGSQILTESVYHNIRNLFTQNLLAQICLAVDKMSQRHAPASLVIFCGKAAAYAFMFVPGIADILVRLWRIQPETLKRVADEFGLPGRPNRIEDDDVISSFPAHVRGLGWTSLRMMGTKLRQKTEIPIPAKHTAWEGPWLPRWCGRDTDLFYVFTKHYHLLANEFMSPDLSFSDKARAPGMSCLVSTKRIES